MSYCIWIPILIITSFIYGKLSYNINKFGENWVWVAIVYAAVIQPWPIIAKFSKNLVFDGLLYDVILTLTFAISMAYFSKHPFTTINYFGIFILVVGLILVKR